VNFRELSMLALIATASVPLALRTAAADDLHIDANIYFSKDRTGAILFAKDGPVLFQCGEKARFHMAFRSDLLGKLPCAQGQIFGDNIKAEFSCKKSSNGTVCEGDFPDRLRLSDPTWGSWATILVGDNYWRLGAESVVRALNAIKPYCRP
jgi:hypothetical protein